MTIDSVALGRVKDDLRGYELGFPTPEKYRGAAQTGLLKLLFNAEQEGSSSDEAVLREALALLAQGPTGAGAAEDLLNGYKEHNRRSAR
jgi:hypothetical protein